MDKSFQNLLAKYDVPGPRYTSYPTVPAWVSTIGPSDYKEDLKKLKGGEPLSLYFHIPFCESLCHYCGCMTVITKQYDKALTYVDVVNREVDLVLGQLPSPKKERVVSQMHLGGGSPNFLQPEELKKLVLHAQENFTFQEDAEIAVEMHPRTSTQAFCDMLWKLGFNRISVGVQDLDPLVQKLINRNQTFEQTKEMIGYLRSLGFKAFNFDLIYGLPGQSEAGWAKTLEQVLSLKPNRFAVYSYAHVPWVHPVQRSFKDSDIPSPEMKLKFFEMAYTALTQNAYRPIGMDHFALEDDALSKALDAGSIHRNFMGYSTKADAHQIGFGVSAISKVAGNYYQNEKELTRYYDKINSGSPATHRGYHLNQDDHIRRDLIRQLMCTGHIEIPKFEADWKISFADYFKADLPHLNIFIKDGLLTLNEKQLKVVGQGSLFYRNMAMAFDPYLEKIKAGSKTPVFSRTV